MTPDALAGVGFLLTFIAAAWRVRSRSWRTPEFRHVPVVGLFCVSAALGCFFRSAWPGSAWLVGAAMIGVGASMLLAAPTLNHQPSREDMGAVAAALADVETRLRRLEERQVLLTGHYGHRHGILTHDEH